MNKPKIFLACDFELERFPQILENTKDCDIIAGYKISGIHSMREGLDATVKEVRKYTDKILIHDYQKGGTDTPHMAERFMGKIKEAGFNSVIIYPRLFDPIGELEYIREAKENGLDLIVGGKMTHSRGYDLIESHQPDHKQKSLEIEREYVQIYKNALMWDVKKLAIPANDVGFISVLRREMGNREEEIQYYAIGIGPQGGDIENMKLLLKDSSYNLIIGREIYDAKDIKKAVSDLASKLA